MINFLSSVCTLWLFCSSICNFIVGESKQFCARRGTSINSRGQNHIESFHRPSRMCGWTPIYFIDGYNKRTSFPRRDHSERLVCSYLHAARSYLPRARSFVGFLFALRAYLCERSSSSFRPFPLHHLLLTFLILVFSFFFLSCYNRGGRFYLGNPNDLLRPINLEKVAVTTRISLRRISFPTSRIQISKFIFVFLQERKLLRSILTFSRKFAHILMSKLLSV